MENPAGRIWPVGAAVGLYLVALGAMIAVSLRRTDGHFVYPLDDTYIHMAIAKNAAVHHVWGITRYEVTSSTSSPLWTLLLALTYTMVGVDAPAPIVWNAVAATLVVVTTDRLLRARGARSPLVFAVVLAMIFGAALPTLTFVGMEHTL